MDNTLNRVQSQLPNVLATAGNTCRDLRSACTAAYWCGCMIHMALSSSACTEFILEAQCLPWVVSSTGLGIGIASMLCYGHYISEQHLSGASGTYLLANAIPAQWEVDVSWVDYITLIWSFVILPWCSLTSWCRHRSWQIIGLDICLQQLCCLHHFILVIYWAFNSYCNSTCFVPVGYCATHQVAPRPISCQIHLPQWSDFWK